MKKIYSSRYKVLPVTADDPFEMFAIFSVPSSTETEEKEAIKTATDECLREMYFLNPPIEKTVKRFTIEFPINVARPDTLARPLPDASYTAENGVKIWVIKHHDKCAVTAD